MNAKVPVGVANPPVSVDADNACPKVMALAVGQVFTVGVALVAVVELVRVDAGV